jgi:putative heme-binding domain-containing protein
MASLPPPSAAMDTLLFERRARYWYATKVDAGRGAEVFSKICAVCHSMDGKGGNIGPQLDGIGGRGASRLFEDILDPSRYVDKAIRLTLETKNDGNVLSGVVRRDEGDEVVLADPNGNETKIPKSDIASKKETESSLMPPNFADSIPVAELEDLMAYLLTKKAPK